MGRPGRLRRGPECGEPAVVAAATAGGRGSHGASAELHVPHEAVVHRPRRPSRRSRRAASRRPGSRSRNARGSSVHHQWNSSPPSPQSRRFHSRSVYVVCSLSSVWSSRRSGSCQQTSGFQSRDVRRPRARRRCSAQPAPPGKSGRLRKMHASSTSRRDRLAVVVACDRAAELLGLRLELPLLGVEALDRTCWTRLTVGLVREVRAVASSSRARARRRARRARRGTRSPKMHVQLLGRGT